MNAAEFEEQKKRELREGDAKPKIVLRHYEGEFDLLNPEHYSGLPNKCYDHELVKISKFMDSCKSIYMEKMFHQDGTSSTYMCIKTIDGKEFKLCHSHYWSALINLLDSLEGKNE